MSIAWTTIAVLVLLLPGFLFFSGLYSTERFSRDAAGQSAIGQLAGIVLVAFSIHGLVFSAITSTCGTNFLPCMDLTHLFTALQFNLAVKDGQPHPVDKLAAALQGSSWRIFGYVTGLSAIAFILGRLAGISLLRGKARWLAQLIWKHKWTYELAVQPPGVFPYVLVYLLTRVQEAERVLCYHGVLEEFFVAPDGHLSYIVLTDCSRFYLRLDKNAPLTSDVRHWRRIGAGNRRTDDPMLRKRWSYFVIEGEDIANIVFDRIEVPHEPLAYIVRRWGERQQQQGQQRTLFPVP